MDLARFAVRMVPRECGILDHPKGSKLWEIKDSLYLTLRYLWRVATLPILQYWFGPQSREGDLGFTSLVASPEDVR